MTGSMNNPINSGRVVGPKISAALSSHNKLSYLMGTLAIRKHSTLKLAPTVLCMGRKSIQRQRIDRQTKENIVLNL